MNDDGKLDEIRLMIAESRHRFRLKAGEKTLEIVMLVDTMANAIGVVGEQDAYDAWVQGVKDLLDKE